MSLVAAVVCAGSALSGNQRAGQSQTPVFRSNTELVEIDVVVIDTDGNRVHGLTKDDFVLRDRRQPQVIETFSEVRRDVERTGEVPRPPATARVDVASNATAEAGRLIVLLLDDLHVWQGRTETTKGIARKIVTDLGPESSMALLQAGGEHSTEVTNDRTRLLASIEQFKGRRPVRRPLEACALKPIKRDAENPSDFDPGCDIQNAYANLSIVQSLWDAAKILGREDRRRKAFILISESSAGDLSGLFDGGTGVPGAPPNSAAYLSGNLDGRDFDGGVSQRFDALLGMLTAMRRANVATYAIDPRGQVTADEMMLECWPGSANRDPRELTAASPMGPDPCEGNTGDLPQSWGSWVRQAQNGLKEIAAATGGFAVVDSDDFTSGIDQIIDDIDNYYLLGFYTTDLKSKGYRPIQVEVKGRPDLTLRFRRGYEIRADETAKNAKREPLDVLIDNALPSSDLPLRLSAIPMPGEGNRARVAVALEFTMPRATLADSGEERLLDDIRYGVYAIDLKGAKVREHLGSGARVALRPRPGLTTPPDEVTYQLAIEMELPAGQYQLRASAMSDKLGAGGSVYQSLDVPDFSRADLEVTDLLLAYADGPRVPVARDRRDAIIVTQTVAVPRGAVPLAARGLSAGTEARLAPPPPPVLPFEPTLDRVFSAGDTIRLYFATRQRRRAPLLATISALAPDGSTVVTIDRPLSNDGTLDLRLPLGQLPPGGYTLQVDVSDGTRTVKKNVGFAIR
ncbi:MAG: hypothetical protein AMXMBFR57_05860 [Acidimicrobiia bacterium]